MSSQKQKKEAPDRYGFAVIVGFPDSPSFTYTNRSANWLVIVGFNAPAVDNTNNDVILQTQDSAGNAFDIAMRVGQQSAAGQTMQYLPRRMLIPPGGFAQTNVGSNTNMGVVICYAYGGKTSLENALAIL